MKSRLLTSIVAFLLTVCSLEMQAQFDDLYYDYRKDGSVIKKNVSDSYTRGYQNDDQVYEEENVYDSDEYDNYDDYSYSSRIMRFHQPVVNSRYYNSFDNWWYDDYYNDSYYKCSYFFFSSRRRHTRSSTVSWARRCV